MSGYVVCPACGSRIKAGRGHCLRCFEPLPVDGVQGEQPWYQSLQVSQGTKLIAGVVLTLAALLFSAVIWQRAAPEDQAAQPAVAAAKAPVPAPAPGAKVAVPAVPHPEPAQPSTGRPPVLEPGFVDALRTERPPADPAAAVTAYEQTVAKRPDDAETLNKLGLALVAAGKIDEAMPRFERAATLSPDKWAYHFNFAHAASKLLLWDQAVAEYRRARTIQPKDHPSQFNLALALHKKGDEAPAAAEFEKAVALAPSDAKSHLGLAIALERSGRTADAVRSYRQFLQLEPGSPDAEKLKAYVDTLDSAQSPAGR